MKHYVICVMCDVLHYANCGTCLGFGMSHAGGTQRHLLPVMPAEIDNQNEKLTYEPCPECQSTVRGIPTLDETNQE